MISPVNKLYSYLLIITNVVVDVSLLQICLVFRKGNIPFSSLEGKHCIYPYTVNVQTCKCFFLIKRNKLSAPIKSL